MSTIPSEADVRPDQLGPDLWALLQAVGSPIVEAVDVIAIPSSDRPRRCFRVTFADGQILKARRVETPADVARVTRLLSLLDARYFPPVLTHHGCAFLTRWVAGTPVGEHEWSPARVRAGAALLAMLHGLPVSADLAALRRRTVEWEQHLHSLLGELVDRKALEVRHARDIERLATVEAPSHQGTAVCHTDFCGDNIIVTDRGELCVVDNEAITVDAPEYDLARTWCLWPMTPSQQQAFVDGYGAHAHGARFAAHFLHWALIAVVESAAFRTSVGAASARVPLERLAHLLRTHGRREPFRRFRWTG
jgi:aminoglycoside phosphotransferase